MTTCTGNVRTLRLAMQSWSQRHVDRYSMICTDLNVGGSTSTKSRSRPKKLVQIDFRSDEFTQITVLMAARYNPDTCHPCLTLSTVKSALLSTMQIAPLTVARHVSIKGLWSEYISKGAGEYDMKLRHLKNSPPFFTSHHENAHPPFAKKPLKYRYEIINSCFI
jgi:hypothetical protein